ncbi:hypothetical protein [Georgenia muralis]
MTVQQFNDGVEVWLAGRWPRDFHHDFYTRLAAEHPHGNFTLEWWSTFIVHLQAWKAIRPASPRTVTREVETSLDDLDDAWRQACEPYVNRDVTGVTWAQMSAFPDLVARFKPSRRGGGPTSSPVFRAKFCHFLAPQTFPVVDNGVTGVPFGQRYQAHVEGVQREWTVTPAAVQDEMRENLAGLIGTEPAPGYPVVNKVVELCLIGRRAPR